ncbi:MAG TPA: OmpA family protein, partial [Bacteroidales bacterium]|nr:OmpA family protein [Bacteroidales bacterium]
EYSFNKNQIKVNVKYHLTVSKDGYFTVEGDESTIGYENSKDLVHDFVLVPVPKKPVVLPEILYDLGRWELKPQYADSLQGLIKVLEANPNIIVELGAHTDARDTEERNDILSQKRAQSVVDYLIVRGIEADRLVAKGYGERNPRVLQKDFVRAGYTFKNGVKLTESFIDSLPSREVKEAAHQLNRRTEFMIIGTNFKSSGKKETTSSQVKLVTGPERNAIPFKYEGKLNNLVIQGNFNNFTLDFVYEPNLTDASMSGEMAVQMLRDGA